MNDKNKQQGGYILITVVILLAVVMGLLLQFMGQSSISNKISGYNRDTAESLMLAENAINWLFGYYANGADLDGNGLPDNNVIVDLESPNPLPLHYMYYVSKGNTIDQTKPDILQKIADGEAREGKEGSVDQSKVSFDDVFLKITNLYQSNNRPLVLIQNENGIQRTNQNWNDVDENLKAAVWLEVITDVENPSKVIVVAQAAAQSGRSKSYVQRFIGSYSETLGDSDVAGINQAHP